MANAAGFPALKEGVNKYFAKFYAKHSFQINASWAIHLTIVFKIFTPGIGKEIDFFFLYFIYDISIYLYQSEKTPGAQEMYLMLFPSQNHYQVLIQLLMVKCSPYGSVLQDILTQTLRFWILRVIISKTLTSEHTTTCGETTEWTILQKSLYNVGKGKLICQEQAVLDMACGYLTKYRVSGEKIKLFHLTAKKTPNPADTLKVVICKKYT